MPPTSFAVDLTERFEPVITDDLTTYVEGIGEMFREVEELARVDDEGGEPWHKLFDPAAAINEAMLLYLAQLAGVRVPLGMQFSSMREFIERAEARRRGRVDYMVELAQATLTGNKTVVTTERLDGSAWRIRFITRTSETSDPAATEAAIRRGKPAALVLEYAAVAGITWDEAVSTWDASSITWEESGETVP
jgi:hypothetical protein